ncbi:MAG: (4Fe-4S)-binding protein [Bacteroidota bacterium]
MSSASDNNNREYSNGEITVYWKPKHCVHAGVCYTELPNVFRPRLRPWVDINGASTEDIIRIVGDCPTDALTFEYNHKLRPKDPDKTDVSVSTKTKVKYSTNGPIIIKGDFELINEHKEVEECNGTVSFCSCGKSKKKPFCDGTHL